MVSDDGFDINRWVPIEGLETLAVVRGEEQVFYLEKKVSARSEADTLAKMLNDRRALLTALKLAEEHLESCTPADGWGLLDKRADSDRKEALEAARAAIAKAEAPS